MSRVAAVRESLAFMRGNILVLSITRILGMFARGMTFPYASLYILALGGQPEQIGLVNSLAPLAGLLVFPIGGYLADNMGRVKLIGWSGVFSAAVFLIYMFAPSWHWLALGALLGGLMVIQFPPTSAIIADSLNPRDRGRGIAVMNAIASGPAMFAPFVAGWLLDLIGVDVGMRYLYGVLMLAIIIAALINLRFLKESAAPAQRSFRWSYIPLALKDAYGGLPQMLKSFSRPLRALTAVIILGFVANAIAGPFWVVYAKEEIGLSSAQWGSILLIETALRNAMYIPAGMVVDRCGRTKCMLGAQLLALLSVPLFVYATGFWFVLCLRVVAAVANAFFMPASAALLADCVPRAMRGRVMSAIGRGTVMIGASSGGTGGPGLGYIVTVPLMIASFTAGYLYAANPAYPWYVAFVAMLISVLVSAFFLRDPSEAHV